MKKLHCPSDPSHWEAVGRAERGSLEKGCMALVTGYESKQLAAR